MATTIVRSRKVPGARSVWLTTSRRAVSFLISSLTLLVGVVGADAPPADPQIEDLATARADAVNQLGLDVFRQSTAPAKNAIFSPTGLDEALACICLGARGRTAEQLAAALRVEASASSEKLSALHKVMLAENEAGDGQTILRLAAGLWVAPKFPIDAAYVKLVETSFDGTSQPLNFANPQSAADSINAWCGKQTAGKIDHVIDAQALAADTPLVLTTAVYFKGPWAIQFEPKNSRMEHFHVAANRTVDVPMMHLSESMYYASLDDCQALEMPYGTGQWSMLVLLPHATKSVIDVERALTADRLRKLDEGFDYKKVNLSLPRFKFSSGNSLKPALTKVGITDAFSSSADFTGISTSGGLYLSDVIQKAMIDVNEYGTEAAAVTVEVFGATAMPSERPVDFRADRPFLFFLRHNQTGAILFQGRVVDPKAAI